MDTTPPEKIRVSVSQIKKYMRCGYAWWREYGPLKIKPPPKPSAALGTQVHDAIEQFLIHDTPLPDTKAGRIAAAGVDKLRPAAELEIEQSITIPLSENASILCRIDMKGKKSPYVGDHKTTKDFGYALTRSEVLRDVQLLTYCYAAYHETKPPEIDVELIYYRTTGQPVSISVAGVVKWEDIEKNWSEIGAIAEEMAPKKNDPTGDSCEANPGACGDYGGCYHANLCPFSPQNAVKKTKTLQDIFSVDNNGAPTTNHNTPAGEEHKDHTMNKKTADIRKSFGLLSPDAPPEIEQTSTLIAEAARTIRTVAQAGATDKKQIKKILNTFGISKENRAAVLNAAGVSKDGNAMEITETPAPIETPAPKQNAVDKLLGKPQTLYSSPSKGTELFKAKRCNAEDQKDVAVKILRDFAGTTVSAGSLRNWCAEQIAPSTLTNKRYSAILGYANLTPDDAGNITIGGSVEAPGYTEPPQAHDAEFLSPTDVDDDPNEYTNDTPAPVVAPVATPAPAPVAAPVVAPVETPAIASPLVVMVGCLFGATAPNNAVSFSMWIAPYIAEVEARNNAPFFMLDLDYGKGSKMLAGVLEAALKQDKPRGLIVADGFDPLLNVAMPVLIRNGATVIRGN